MNRKKSPVKKRISALISAALLAGISSFAVYASVVYDSSKDPVVAYSAMTQYVTGQLESVLSSIKSLERRVEIVELTGGGSGSGSGSGGATISTDALSKLLDRMNELEKKYSELNDSNQSLRSELNSTRKELNDLISDLQGQYNTIKAEVEGISDEIVNVKNTITSVRKDISTLNSNFKQISTISTKLETVSYKINALTEKGGDIAVLKEQLAEVNKQYTEMLDKAGQLYDVQLVPYGATVYANDSGDSVMLVLRSGSAVAVSPFRDAGTAQGLNDLSDGTEIYDGTQIPLFHNVLIPRGGDDGRGVTVTSIDGAYIMIGGDCRIVQK